MRYSFTKESGEKMYENALRVDLKYIYFLLRNGGHLCPWIAAEIELAPLCFIE